MKLYAYGCCISLSILTWSGCMIIHNLLRRKTDNMKQIMSVRPHVTNYEHNVIKTLCQNTLVIKI